MEGDANDILKAHGTTINEILSGRADSTLDKEKAEGSAHAASYLEEHPTATRTESGLVFHETTAGSGEPPAEVENERESERMRCRENEV